MVYDPVRHRTFVFGGTQNTETWEFRTVLPGSHGLINVDFDTPGAPTQTGVALIDSAGGVWNSVPAQAGAMPTTILVDARGDVSPVTIRYSGSSGGYDADTATSFAGTALAPLMRDYLYAGAGGTASITLSGLVPGSEHDLVLFSHPDLGVSRTSHFTVNGVSQDAVSNGTGGELVRGVNYVRFERVTASALGELQVALTRSPTGGGSLEADVNGLQLAPLPAPATGACCQGSTCTVTTPSSCSGTFLGPGVSCAPLAKGGSRLNPCCPADINASGAVSVQDIFDFLAAYFGGCP
jgi:hypothetical protein